MDSGDGAFTPEMSDVNLRIRVSKFGRIYIRNLYLYNQIRSPRVCGNLAILY